MKNFELLNIIKEFLTTYETPELIVIQRGLIQHGERNVTYINVHVNTQHVGGHKFLISEKGVVLLHERQLVTTHINNFNDDCVKFTLTPTRVKLDYISNDTLMENSYPVKSYVRGVVRDSTPDSHTYLYNEHGELMWLNLKLSPTPNRVGTLGEEANVIAFSHHSNYLVILTDDYVISMIRIIHGRTELSFELEDVLLLNFSIFPRSKANLPLLTKRRSMLASVTPSGEDAWCIELRLTSENIVDSCDHPSKDYAEFRIRLDGDNNWITQPVLKQKGNKTNVK